MVGRCRRGGGRRQRPAPRSWGGDRGEKGDDESRLWGSSGRAAPPPKIISKSKCCVSETRRFPGRAVWRASSGLNRPRSRERFLQVAATVGRLRDEEIESEPFSDVLGGELTANAVTGRVQGRGERRQPS